MDKPLRKHQIWQPGKIDFLQSRKDVFFLSRTSLNIFSRHFFAQKQEKNLKCLKISLTKLLENIKLAAW